MLTFVGDFETTVFEGQTFTEVWASALVPLYTEDVEIFTSIDSTFDYLFKLKQNCIVYYHNLKFDGQFIVSYLLNKLNFKLAYNEADKQWLKKSQMPARSFTITISDMGQWYSITIKNAKYTVEVRDSVKLIPLSVEKMGKSFNTKHKKTSINYEGLRFANGVITEQEREYIKNDVLVVKEALEYMFSQGHTKLTIGSCCLSEYKNLQREYDDYFCDLSTMLIDEELYGSSNAEKYIRKSYKGGWCYVDPRYRGRIVKNGSTADVNSLYPSMMSSESGNKYPVGHPTFWHGNYIPDKALEDNRYYFIRIKTRFDIKPLKLPFIQLKGNYLYRQNECLTTSDIIHNNKRYRKYLDCFNEEQDTRVILTLTCTDFELLKEHYTLTDFEILDGCYFFAEIGIFDCYIEKYKELKLKSTGGMREIAKLYLNNLYGKLSSSDNSSFKIPYLDENGVVCYDTILANDKPVVYIPCGSAITSYARCFTIKAAQANYKFFAYADTDSIHCVTSPDKLKGIKIHDKNFCCWKVESEWDYAYFARQKTYIEHNIKQDGEYITPYHNIKCAGMPERCKELFNLSLNGYTPDNDTDEFTEEEKIFLKTKRTIKDFDIGLRVPSKLIPKRIYGGIILVNTTYEMR